MKKYGVELAEALHASKLYGFANQCVSFVEYLVDLTISVHNENKHVQQPSVIPQSYNPEKRAAYYFTPHGNQVQKQPHYCIAQAKKNFDDIPTIDNICNKKFPVASNGGFGYMFLWFCPIHGHCYGFHLIAGGEGRKDPFSSLFNFFTKSTY